MPKGILVSEKGDFGGMGIQDLGAIMGSEQKRTSRDGRKRMKTEQETR